MQARMFGWKFLIQKSMRPNPLRIEILLMRMNWNRHERFYRFKFYVLTGKLIYDYGNLPKVNVI